MRSKDNIRQPEKGIVLGGRLLFEHVQRRAGDPTFRQRLHQGGLIDHRAARGIDEKRGALHEPELSLSHQMARAGGQWAVNGNHVRFAADLLETGGLHACFGHFLAPYKWIEGNDLRLKACELTRDGSPDTPEANQAYRASGQLKVGEDL